MVDGDNRTEGGWGEGAGGERGAYGEKGLTRRREGAKGLLGGPLGLAGALSALRYKRRDGASTLGLAIPGLVGGLVGALRAQGEL
jgi:hypothetical protein